ncbi:hypothetical protein [Deinococcus ruber]|uniref:Uncharacterized protein n=1 Tax=Deinococcus ruber TaxID=1848197 RepID=A0A918F8I3_9DEIO|nr:hypothetical protein [Deinococcus ruber]GGR18995.1 hypothetical protein GCM10008957_34580 [Deinococcus ruber]
MIYRIEIRNSIGLLRLVLALLHLGMSVVLFIRPHMVELIKGYARFGDIAPTTEWGWYTLIVGLGLLLLPRASPLLILWQAASATLFALFAILATAVVGLNWGTVVYGGLSLASALVAYITADGWFIQTQLPQRFRAWLRRTRRSRHG